MKNLHFSSPKPVDPRKNGSVVYKDKAIAKRKKILSKKTRHCVNNNISVQTGYGIKTGH